MTRVIAGAAGVMLVPARQSSYGSAVIHTATGQFAATGSMLAGREGHTATPLANGRVLIAGGYTQTAEIYDHATGTFPPTGSTSVQRAGHTATLLPDGRVLVDALGERYSRPPIHRLFKGSKVRVARFLPPSLSGRGIHFNLRSHRKLLVIDGAAGFTGGMNIGDRHLADLAPD